MVYLLSSIASKSWKDANRGFVCANLLKQKPVSKHLATDYRPCHRLIGLVLCCWRGVVKSR